VPLVDQLAAAVKAGDVAKAKSLYAESRIPWEAVEPVAESFGDLDPKVDLREADLEAGQEWTGWHRIEKALWTDGDLSQTRPVADQLAADVRVLQERVATADLTVASIGNGAKELLDEVATGKITGEEEAFSHTDLVDFQANLDGAKKGLRRPFARWSRTPTCSTSWTSPSPRCRRSSTSTVTATPSCRTTP
jgi:iron uptake system component EfeO